MGFSAGIFPVVFGLWRCEFPFIVALSMMTVVASTAVCISLNILLSMTTVMACTADRITVDVISHVLMQMMLGCPT